jgi:hypothetical protein
MHSAMKRAAGGGGGEATVRKRLSAKRRPLVTGDTLRETGRGAFLSVERGVSVGCEPALPHRCAFSQPDEKNAPRPAVGSTLSQGSLSSRQKVMRPAQTKRRVAEEAPEGGGGQNR